MNLRYIIDFKRLEIIKNAHFREIGISLPLPKEWD